jgi:hypothetical protein
MTWVQSQLLSLNLGQLNDRPIVWSQHYGGIIMGCFVWLGAFSLFVLLRHYFHKILIQLGFIFLAMMLTGIITQSQTLPKPLPHQLYTSSQDLRHSFSKDKNVLLIILDTFQSDVFEEIVYRYPELKNQLGGFTYFKDFAGGFQATTPALPLILSGQYYTNQEPFQAFIQNAYAASSLPLSLKHQGFYVYLDCNQYILCSGEINDALIPKTQPRFISPAELITIYKPTLIRNFPSVFYWAYQQTKSEISQAADLDFTPKDNSYDYYLHDQNLLASFLDQAAVNSREPAFRFFHFTAPHPPLYLNAKGQYELQPDTREGQINHSLGALHLALSLIDHLKKLKVYDQTLIILMSDHGYGPLGYKVDPQSPLIQDPVISAALPLLLVKPFNAHNPYHVDITPTAQATLSQDIINYLESKKDFSLTQTNPRHFYYYNWNEDHEPDYLPPLTHYVIEGHIRDQNAWEMVSTKL